MAWSLRTEQQQRVQGRGAPPQLHSLHRVPRWSHDGAPRAALVPRLEPVGVAGGTCRPGRGTGCAWCGRTGAGVLALLGQARTLCTTLDTPVCGLVSRLSAREGQPHVPSLFPPKDTAPRTSGSATKCLCCKLGKLPVQRLLGFETGIRGYEPVLCPQDSGAARGSRQVQSGCLQPGWRQEEGEPLYLL